MAAGEDQPEPVVLDRAGRLVRGVVDRSWRPAGAWRRGATRGGSGRCALRRPWWSATRRGWGVRRRRATARRRRAAPRRPPPRRRRCRRSGGPARRRPGRTPRGRSARSSRSGRSLGLEGPDLDLALAGRRPLGRPSFSAASRSGASMTQKPPSYSFDSANGPSVMIGSGPVASTVVVDSIGSRPPPNTQMPASVTFWLKASTWREHALHVVAGGHLLAHLVVHAEHVLRHGVLLRRHVGSTPPRTAARRIRQLSGDDFLPDRASPSAPGFRRATRRVVAPGTPD